MVNDQIKISLSDIRRLSKNGDIHPTGIVLTRLIKDKDRKAILKYFEYVMSKDPNSKEMDVILENILSEYERTEYIKILDENDPLNYAVLAKLEDVFGNEIDPSDWIEDWRKIFPSGKNANGYRYRGDKAGCLSKMKKFIKNNPQVTKEEIFTATKKYVERFGYSNFMKLAHFFIYKENVSQLASEVEGLTEDDIEQYSFTNRL